MVARLSDLQIALGYSTGDDDLVRDFYIPCLGAAHRYYRAAGYFRSTLYILVGLAFSDFVRRGGKIRLICSPSLSQEDIDALRAAYEEIEIVGRRTLHDVKSALDNPLSRPVGISFSCREI